MSYRRPVHLRAPLGDDRAGPVCRVRTEGAARPLQMTGELPRVNCSTCINLYSAALDFCASEPHLIRRTIALRCGIIPRDNT